MSTDPINVVEKVFFLGFLDPFWNLLFSQFLEESISNFLFWTSRFPSQFHFLVTLHWYSVKRGTKGRVYQCVYQVSKSQVLTLNFTKFLQSKEPKSLSPTDIHTQSSLHTPQRPLQDKELDPSRNNKNNFINKFNIYIISYVLIKDIECYLLDQILIKQKTTTLYILFTIYLTETRVTDTQSGRDVPRRFFIFLFLIFTFTKGSLSRFSFITVTLLQSHFDFSIYFIHTFVDLYN